LAPSHSDAVHFLVLQGWTAEVDALARVLAETLGKNLPEARTRLLAGGPIVVAGFLDPEPTATMADTLRSRGIADPLVIGDGELETDAERCFVRDFDLGDCGLRVADHQRSLDVAYGEIELLLRGTRVEAHTTRGKPASREFSLARTVMSGGLMLTRPVVGVQAQRTEERTGFLHLYAGQRPVVVLRETDLRFHWLGAALRPSRHANFKHLVAELRRRAPAAIYDDRLLQRGGQVQLLGPGLSPDRYLDLALSVLAHTLRTKI
jgi:hypothetical protein